MTVTPLALGNALQGGKYRLDALLSQGGFGVTYRATHTLLDQTIVLKTLNAAQHDPQQIAQIGQRFIHEAQRLAKFQHPHIVRVSDCFIEGGLPFIVMDYIPGQTLAGLVKNKPLPPAQAIHYIQQVGSALSLVHDHGLLHRDVKPDNIMLRQGTDSVVLIDFGIAREYTPGKVETNTGMLSAGYAPVEQYLPKHQWSPATDIYALAATLYALLAAKPPVASVLRDRIPLERLRDIQPDISPELEDAILAGMALDAPDRPQSVRAWLELITTPTKGRGRSAVSSMTTSTVAVLPQTRPVIPVTKPALDHRSGGRSSRVSASEPAWNSPWVWLLATALLGSGLGAVLGFWLRQQPVIPGAPPILRQEEEFPPTRPPLTPEPLPRRDEPEPLPPTDEQPPETPATPEPSPDVEPGPEDLVPVDPDLSLPPDLVPSPQPTLTPLPSPQPEPPPTGLETPNPEPTPVIPPSPEVKPEPPPPSP